MANSATPLLDELTTGPWPSFVNEFKKLEGRKPIVKAVMQQLETSYRDKISHWKHGGIVGVLGYGGGVIGRYSDLAEQIPDVAHFHTMRINQPSGWFYTSAALRTIADIWEKHGSGITNMHGSTGDIVFLGTRTENLEPCFADLTAAGFDLGGSGSDMRTPSCCCGMARCEWACYDTMGFTYDLTMHFQDQLHRPAFPYKFKIKSAGCPNDCVASVARSDLSVIGTWKDNIQQDDAEVKKYVDGGLDIVNEVVMLCPTRCMRWDAKANKLAIENENCVRCMHCINCMPKALRPGKQRGAALLLGAKAPIVEGAMLSTVIIPFIEMKAPFTEIKELIEKMWEFWDEHGKNRERIGELYLRVGFGNFLEAIEVPPVPQMILHPRENPYVFYEEYFSEDEE